LNRPAAAPAPIGVLLAIGQPTLLAALQRAIDARAPAMHVVAACHGIQDAIRRVAQLKPGVVVVGAETCGADWEDALKRLDHPLVLLLVPRADAVVYRRAAFAGARGVIEAPDAERWIAYAVERVFAGEAWIPRSAFGELVEAVRIAAPLSADRMNAVLTKRKKPPKR
jgi:two-component system, NarL family, nitrate/nitrite response regulator NarL